MGRSDHNCQHPAVSYCTTSVEKNRSQIDGTILFSLLDYSHTLFFINHLRIMQNLTFIYVYSYICSSKLVENAGSL